MLARVSVEERLRAALGRLAQTPVPTVETPVISYARQRDVVHVAFQEPIGDSPRLLYVDVDPDIELHFDATRLGRLLGVVLRSPVVARGPAWWAEVEAVVGPVLARHVRAIATRPSEPYAVTDLDRAAVAELRLAWARVHDEARRDAGITSPTVDDAERGSLVADLVRAARGGFRLSAPSFPWLRLAPAGAAARFRTRAEPGTGLQVWEEELDPFTAEVLGVRVRLRVAGRSGEAHAVEVTMTGDAAWPALAAETPAGTAPLMPGALGPHGTASPASGDTDLRRVATLPAPSTSFRLVLLDAG
jgi:hypothetical protein